MAPYAVRRSLRCGPADRRRRRRRGRRQHGHRTVHEGVTYAERDAGELELDPFVPDADVPPLVVYLHGGGWVAASPLTHVPGDCPPVSVMHGREDEAVSIEHGRRLVDALDDAGVDCVAYELHDLNRVRAHGGVDSIESERVAMDRLTAEPTPAQSVYGTTRIPERGAATPPVDGVPPAGPEPIRRFLDRTIRR